MENRPVVAKGEGLEEGWTGSLELAMQTIICRMHEQQGPTV